MTLEEAVAQLEAANATITKLTTSVEKLEGKTKELQTEKQRARAEADAAEAAREEAAEKAERDAKDVEALERRLTAKFQKDIDRLTGERDTATARLRTTLVDNEIAKALRDNSVRDGMDEALTALFQSKVVFENGAATIDSKSIGEFASSYLGSDAGAFFRRPSNNSGADASGNTSKTAQPRMTKDNFNYTEFARIQLENPEEANAIADAVGRPNLKTPLK